MAASKKKMAQILPDSTFELKDSSLNYVPFMARGSDYVYAGSGLSINRNALKFAREL